MIEHNLTLAWRQLVKYRLQSAVSVVSLAIGFACFALASMWIKYETTYDEFHKDADRMYCLIRERNTETIDWQMDGAFCDSVIKYCHEVEAATPFLNGYEWDLRQNGTFLATIEYTSCDSSFLEMFNIQILAGTDGFLHNDREVAINRLTAEKLWPNQNPLGQEFTLDGGTEGSIVPYTVTAVVDGWDEHSSLHFDLLRNNTSHKNYNPFKDYNIPFSPSFAHILRLSPHADVDDINARLDTLDFFGNRKQFSAKGKFKLLPLDQLRYTIYQGYMNVKLNYIYLFALASSLLILCGLLNYLTMFINRLFIRQREIALRTVFGATGRNLTVQFLTEYGLLLLIAAFFGLIFMKWVLAAFRQLAELPEGWGFFYRETFISMFLVLGVSLLISLPVIQFFRRQALQNSIQAQVGLFSYNNFRKLSVCLQIGISIFFIFCTVVFQKQIHALRYNDFGFERNNIGLIQTYDLTEDEIESFASYLRQQPEVVKLIRRKNSLFPNYKGAMIGVGGAFGPNRDKVLKEIVSLQYFEDKEYAMLEFYGLKLLKGRYLCEEDDPIAIVVNETTVKKFNWDDPIGKKIEYSSDEILHVVGVVKDFYNMGPLRKPNATFFCKEMTWIPSNDPGTMFVFKYQGEDWKTLKRKYEEYIKRYEGGEFFFEDAEEEFDKFLESELNLQKLLNVITIVCILIALFGVWSMIMLTCEQRRKEIAIRKVFGATVKDILDMFFLEYMALQAVAAVVAFPIGYACMKPWLEQYVVQTEISWWIYVGIFLLVALLVALCIGWRVWKTATARPADEICKG
ncbi:MAG: ABC transporter permease [Bacteroidaceae bacterium]|nr:ABC transporter permease [Bacteroidaceae bacterium]